MIWSRADGTEVLAPVYLGTAQLDAFASFPAFVTVLGDETLVGRGVSDRFRVILDHGQQVIVEP
jgi:hypothetical protein